MSSRRTATLATLLALALSAALAGPALATPVTLAGAPLAVYVDELGQLQAKRDDGAKNIFYDPDSTKGDAGFFLAFPAASGSADLDGGVFGFEPTASAGTTGIQDYVPISQSPATGSGTAADPLKQVTRYAVSPTADTPRVEVTQTTTYVNGAQQFSVRWDVKNTAGAALKLKALAAADFFFDGSDKGTGIYTEGPPRFIGGTNADTGNSGGFAEVTGGTSPSPRWSHYQALAWGVETTDVWPQVEASATTAPTFNDEVVGEPVDNAGGVEWDQYLTAPIPDGATRSFELTVKNAVPALLQLTPSNAGSPRGVPINVTATAVNTDGVPYAGRSLRYAITGANAGAGSVTLDGNGQGTISDPGALAGADTIVAFVDFNNDGIREPAEPQASSLATFVDQVAPSCTVKVSGDRPGGSGGAGKPLKITVSCNESATVKVATTLSVPRKQASKSTADAAKKKRKKKPIKIKLKASSTLAAPGQAVPVRISIPKKVRKKYAGKKVKATVTITATDASGNVKKVTRSRSIKLAKLKKKKAKKRG
jgi:hypothetical protein